MTGFFKKHANLHITTTAIRSMYDMETDELVSRNIISKQHQDSVLWLNGHTGAISRQHYIKKKKVNAVKDGRHVMNLILNGSIDRESCVDDASRVYREREGKQHDVRIEYSEGDYDADERESTHYDDSLEPFEFEQDGKLIDDSDRDQEHGKNEWYSDDDGPFSHHSGRDDYHVNYDYGYDSNEREVGENSSGRDDYHVNYDYGYDSNECRGGENSRYRWHDHSAHCDDAENELEMRSNGRRYRYDNNMTSRENRHASFSSNHSRADTGRSRRIDGAKITKEIPTESMPIRRGMSDRYERTYYNDSCNEELEVLRPLPLRMVDTSREAYVTWSNDEIEYTRRAYDIIYAQLPPDQKRYIAKELLKHIRNDANARRIFHPSHLENSGKFRHVIRAYVQR